MKDGKILFRYHTLHAHVTCFFQNTLGTAFCLHVGLLTAVAHLSYEYVGPLKGLMLIKSGVVSIMTLGQNLRTRCPKIGLAIFGDILGTILSPGGCPRNIFEGYQGILKLFHNPAGDWNPGWGGVDPMYTF